VRIVGRDDDLATVDAFLGAVASSSCALVIDGEAGIGKTTLWREALARASQHGCCVLAARPAEAEAKLSYAALADLLGSAYDEARDDLPPPQRQALDVALLRAETEAGADPRSIAMGLLGVLGALAAERSVVVAVDDVQWLDRASERALEFAVRRLPARVGVLVARRSDGAGDSPLGLGRTVPESQIARVVLGPLSLAALHRLIRSQLGTAPPRPVLVRIAAAAGGNPFYALELARSAHEVTPGERLPVSDSLQELVLTRVRRLSPRGRDAVLAAAALSRPTVPTIAAALGVRGEAVTAVGEAEEAGVIVVRQDRIEFAHPLLASAVYASASRARRRRLHGRLGEVVSDPEERARHLAQSATDADPSIAAEIDRAAAHAARRGAQDAAAELYDAAVRLTPDDRPDEAAHRMLGEAAALFAVGDPTGARSVAEGALGRAESVTLRAEANLLLGGIAWVERPGRAVTEYLERALALAVDDSRLRGRIHAKLGEVSLLDQRKALEHTDAAAALLDENDDPSLLAHVLINKFFYSAQVGRKAPHELLERALRLEERAGPDAEKSRIPLMWFSWVDELDAARERHALEDRWYRDRGEEGWRAERLGHLAQIELIAGNWEVAEQMIEESCAAIDQMRAGAGPWGMMWRIRALVDLHRGRIERARESILPLIEESERTGHRFFAAISLSTLGSVELAAGLPEAADRAFVRTREHLDAIGAVGAMGPRHEPDHVEALLALGALDRARAVLEHLEWRGRTIPRPWITVALPRVRALVIAAEGDVEAALAQLEALDSDAAARVPYEYARTLLVKGRLHRRLRQKRAGAEALGEALELFEHLGAPIWAEQARSELGRIGLRRPAPDELTPSERRVAELAAAGLTNREVAQTAFMSPKTVEANLARIYRKLGIRSRAELGARMAANGGERLTQT
jgi:DNA-binding CsgD family transcriptional regulator